MQESDEQLQAQRCHQGDTDALAGLREQFHGRLAGILMARGATRTETEDLLADLWADCVPGDDDRPSLLEKFNGRCSLQSWLATVATNRLIDLKRKQKRRGDGAVIQDEGDGTNFFERVAAPVSSIGESELTELLRDSLQKAFTACSEEGLLMLRLVYLHGLSQRDVARLWNCHESTVSRVLNQALAQIESCTLEELKLKDPWLTLNWQDFLDLCQTQEVGFL